MALDTRVATALLSALRLAAEHGGAQAALRASGLELPLAERFGGLSEDLGELLGRSGEEDPALVEAIALGLLAGGSAARRRARITADATSFVMDRDLVVQDAAGESVLRLPWIEDGLFVGRQLPDITEMPSAIRFQCIEHYTAALSGARGQFAFSSYGHAYTVDVVPVHGDGGTIEGALGIASPISSYVAAAEAYARTAESRERAAAGAQGRAERHRRAGRRELENAERRVARQAQRTAERARDNALRLHARAQPQGFVNAPAVTRRELEVLELASHGLTSGEIADQLEISVGTVKTHLQNVYPKLGASDKAAAVATALRHGLIQ